MNDLISREDLYHDMNMKRLELHEKGLSWNEFCRGFSFAMEFIKQAPIAEQDRKTGKWIVHDYAFGRERYECTECKGKCDLKYNFCPHCGADMRDGQ